MTPKQWAALSTVLAIIAVVLITLSTPAKAGYCEWEATHSGVSDAFANTGGWKVWTPYGRYKVPEKKSQMTKNTTYYRKYCNGSYSYKQYHTSKYREEWCYDFDAPVDEWRTCTGWSQYASAGSWWTYG